MVRVVRLERTVSWSQTRRDTNFAIPGYSIFAIIPRGRGKSKFFLSVVIPVVKTAFVPFSATGEKPAIARVARLCGVSQCPVPDTATAHPKQARYQLRYTRLLSYSIRLVVFSQTTRATSCANPGFLVIQFCTRCGQTCGHGDFLTTSTCGGNACIAGVSRDCGHSVFRLEGGATRSQIKRDTSFATPGYLVLRRGESLYGAVCAGDAACKATAWGIDSADGVCAGRCVRETTLILPCSAGKSNRVQADFLPAPCFA